MKDWFEWNDVRSTDLGVVATELPPLTVPKERVTFVNVPGRSGSLTVTEGKDVYDDVTLACECYVRDESRYQEIIAWLHGGGIVRFANRPDMWYEARIVNQIPFEKILRGRPNRKFTVNFRCKPFGHVLRNEPIELTEADNVYNEYAIDALPAITIEGDGDITLMVGGELFEFADVDGYITIDSELEEVYKDTEPQNNKHTGDFPHLFPGWTAVSWDGDVDTVTIVPNWRTL